jgi:hypothetical protein
MVPTRRMSVLGWHTWRFSTYSLCNLPAFFLHVFVCCVFTRLISGALDFSDTMGQ